MERLSDRRTRGMHRGTLALWGIILASLEMISRGLLQNGFLGLADVTNDELLAVLDSSGTAMTMATLSLVLQAMAYAAVPIFTLLTVDGFRRSGDAGKYILRVAAVAAVSELPYNLAMSGKLLDTGSRNPVFGLVLVLVMLYLFRHYEGKEFGRILIKLFVLAAAWLWAAIFRVETGRSMVLMAAALWLFAGRPTMSVLAAAAVALMCCVGDPLFMFAPFGFLLTHFYNGEEGDIPRPLRYALYPSLLLLTAVIEKML